MRLGGIAGVMPAVALLLMGCIGMLETTGSETESSPRNSYWREYWLLKELANESELKEFESLYDENAAPMLGMQEAQRRWLGTWWQKHDPDWTTPENEWRDYIDSLAAIADWRYDKILAANKIRPPWDDRGLYLIHFGPPDFIETANAVYCSDFGGVVSNLGELWTWYPHSNRNKRKMSVLFAPGCDFEYIAKPFSPDMRDLVQFGEVTALHKTSPPAGYSPDKREPLPFTLSSYRFHQFGDSTDLWLAYALPVSELCDGADSVRLRCTLTLGQNVRPREFQLVHARTLQIRRERELRLSCAHQVVDGVAMQVERFVLPSGDYQIGIKIDDLTDTTRGFTGKLSTAIVPFEDPDAQKLVSDPLPLAAAPGMRRGFDTRFTREIGDRYLELTPLPGHVLRRKQDTLRVYHEVYDLVTDNHGRARVRLTYTLFRDSKGTQQPIDTLLEQIVTGRGPSLPCYHQFPTDNFKKGEYFLLIESRDLNDERPPTADRKRQTILRFKVS